MSKHDPIVIVDFPESPRRTFERPDAVLHTHVLSEVRDVLREVQMHVAQGRYAVGFVSYEAAPAFDAKMKVLARGAAPLVWFGIYQKPREGENAGGREDRTVKWREGESVSRFRSAVLHIRREIAAGTTYQVNITARLHADFSGDPFSLYETLRHAQGHGYHAYISTDEFSVLSVSPEMFFQLDNGHITTRPMKGTRPRGRWIAEDEQLAQELSVSEKDRAENLMIVDLLRNDLGRIAEYGTVEVKSLYDIEQYRTVHQMTSTITAELRDDVDLLGVFDALFPCGSVTGAPKISAMDIITQLEESARGVYCGALGIIEPGGRATFNVPIRTVFVDHAEQHAVYGTGAGITYDSDPDAEHDEIVSKAVVLTESWPEFELLETMRCENGRVIRLNGHLARMRASARYFGFPFNDSAVHELLTELPDGIQRVRLLCDAQGRMSLEWRPLDEPLQTNVAMAAMPVDSRNRFLFHKTTHRTEYEKRLSARADVWDVLLWNEAGEVTEFTRGNLVAEIDGVRFTPPMCSGLLPGVFREELVSSGSVRERVLYYDDVVRASRLWLINSLREWVPVTLSPGVPARYSTACENSA